MRCSSPVDLVPFFTRKAHCCRRLPREPGPIAQDHAHTQREQCQLVPSCECLRAFEAASILSRKAGCSAHCRAFPLSKTDRQRNVSHNPHQESTVAEASEVDYGGRWALQLKDLSLFFVGERQAFEGFRSWMPLTTMRDHTLF